MSVILNAIPRKGLLLDFPVSMPLRALKPVTYGLMHLVVAISVAFVLTGSWTAALAIGLIEPAVQTVAYTLHERAWNRAPAPSVDATASAH
ncbi:hypothetical protein OA2633_10854 [Oceanicaulis alexandrii HTCC2633]|jgi:uncharacterized membrane protein|uniref:DUF2061 domain-containing protein n=1 Tax=Oceanicaulis sp. HTCC2633 TaxID=314254 RepID=UPI000066D300|nr:DUF2061 domain-containing protein [Oceanicaulis sp. HTCC2633]EAP88746.1 hypothetical protein OA2633_10854 [Oceanicaulis alexandrii HTCC2633] [Oceanicaulis sp. HTCC2633]